MKSEIQNTQSKLKTIYPCLKKYITGDYGTWIVLFIYPDEGTMVYNSNIKDGMWKIGFHSNNWGEMRFENLESNEKVILSN